MSVLEVARIHDEDFVNDPINYEAEGTRGIKIRNQKLLGNVTCIALVKVCDRGEEDLSLYSLPLSCLDYSISRKILRKIQHMEAWFIIIVSFCIATLLKSIFSLLSPPWFSNSKKKLPPGPPSFPLLGNLIWLRKPISDIEFILRQLKPRYGPLITMKIADRSFIFVGCHSLAHEALIHNGAVFADRPPGRILNRAHIAINSAPYGPRWRLLRRNLTQEILHPSRVRGYSSSRRWVLSLLIHRLRADTTRSERLIDHFQYAMFCLLVLMCFGDKLQENQIKEIETVHRRLLLGFRRFNALNFWPRLGRIIFRKRWKELIQLRDHQDKVLIPLIRARHQAKQTRNVDKDNINQEDEVVAYVDTLVDLQLPEENRKLKEEEIVSLCGEFLSAGTDTTSTALQWIMANLVKYPQIQDKLYQEIIGVVGQPPQADTDGTQSNRQVVEEKDLQKMPYLIPKDAFVNFMVADMGWDPKVWKDPMEFKPERFLAATNTEAFDISGSREIKMMPFGAGRRVCPGSALALLHLEYFVANLIWYFEWTPLEGDEVDLSEKQEFTFVMMNPLQARISTRM